MDVYLATSSNSWVYEEIKGVEELFILESFAYMNNLGQKNIHNTKKFLLDSGAFTFVRTQKNAVDWLSYVDRYAEFVKANNVQLFFELDIDKLIGYDAVLKLRKLRSGQKDNVSRCGIKQEASRHLLICARNIRMCRLVVL